MTPNNTPTPVDDEQTQINQIVNQLHTNSALMGIVNDGKAHRLYNHASGDKCEQIAIKAIKSLIHKELQGLVEQSNTYTTVLQGYEAKLEAVPTNLIQERLKAYGKD